MKSTRTWLFTVVLGWYSMLNCVNIIAYLINRPDEVGSLKTTPKGWSVKTWTRCD